MRPANTETDRGADPTHHQIIMNKPTLSAKLAHALAEIAKLKSKLRIATAKPLAITPKPLLQSSPIHEQYAQIKDPAERRQFRQLHWRALTKTKQ
jgi:hypothetical protein